MVICIQKRDESMNPYESTMNPIQKTDESMNPSYLMITRNPVFFLQIYNGFMDSSVFSLGFIADSYGFMDSFGFVRIRKRANTRAAAIDVCTMRDDVIRHVISIADREA